MAISLKQRVKGMLPPGLLKPMQKAHYALWMMCHPAARAEARQMRRLREQFNERNASAAPGEIILRPGVRFFAHPTSAKTFDSFCWTPRGVHEMDAFLADTADRKCLLDIGAFHGIFSLAFCARGGRSAYSFEPSPQPFEVLQHNATSNRQFGIQPNRIAIGEAPGELQMSYEWQHLVATPAAAGQAAPPGSVTVPITTMDAFCVEHSINPDTVKIDVEGFEYQVLRGGRQTLARLNPMLFMEIHPKPLMQYGASIPAIWELLHSVGYEILDVARNPLDQPPNRTDTFNIVCRARQQGGPGR